MLLLSFLLWFVRSSSFDVIIVIVVVAITRRI